ncbi:helix-turn-helix domain-containing protein [Candidatus Latescibacterota bacterium]
MPQGRRTRLRVPLTREIREELESWQRSTTIPAGLARRGRAILLLVDGVSVSDVSRLVGMERRHVYKWARRFLAFRVAGLHDRPRGRPPSPPESPRQPAKVLQAAG